MISYCHRNVVCLTVSPSVCLWRRVLYAKRYVIIQQKCMNKWIGSTLLATRFYNFKPPTATLSHQTPHPPKLQNLHIWNSHGQHADHSNSRQRSVAVPYTKENAQLRGVYIMLTWRTCRSYCLCYFCPDICNAVPSAISATAALLVSTTVNFQQQTINNFTMFHTPGNQAKTDIIN